jgi:ADP-ribose pyrophosphatase YjhB (NUDIX family)
MKRLGVAAIITNKNDYHLLLGHRGKEPNRGLYVLPGGGVEDGETLEQAFCREILEETGLEIDPDINRWNDLIDVIELSDRVILVAHAFYFGTNTLKDGSDLYDVAWFDTQSLPNDISPVIKPVLLKYGYKIKKD